MLLNRFMIRPLVEQGLREELSAGTRGERR